MSITFLQTRDPKLLQQYHALRLESYHNDKLMDGHFNKGLPDAFDMLSDVIVAVEHGEVVAGARLTVSEAEAPTLLPSETRECRFQDLLPQLSLEGTTYGEVHRVVIRKDKRNRDTLSNLLMEVCKYIYRENWDYFFTPSIPVKARLYQCCSKRIGVNLERLKDVKLVQDKYDGVPMELMICDVKNQPLYRQLKKSMPSEGAMISGMGFPLIRSVA